MNDVEVTVRGNVGSNVERIAFSNGNSIVRFTVANTNRYFKDGEWVDGRTTWYQVDCRKALAENVIDCVVKGQPVIVQGTIVLDAWEKQDGARREKLVLNAVAVGHDLNRGTAKFAKVTRQQSPEGEDVESQGPAPDFAGSEWAKPAEAEQQAPEGVLAPA